MTGVEVPPAWGQRISVTATGLRRTDVYQTSADTFRWWLRPGADALASASVPTDELRAPVTAASGAEITFVLPDRHGDGLLYRTGSPISAALWYDVPVRDRLAVSLAAVVTGLRRLHAIRPAAALPPPPALSRLGRWLDGSFTHDRSARLHAVAARCWGTSGLGRLRHWVTTSGAGRPGHLLHGNTSLGAVLPPLGSARPTEILTGPELSTGDDSFDIGWLLGELLELSFVAAGSNPDVLPDMPADRVVAAVLRAAGDIDRAAVERVMVLRVVTHLQDFASAMAWTDELFAYVDLIGTLLQAAPGDLTTGRTHD